MTDPFELLNRLKAQAEASIHDDLTDITAECKWPDNAACVLYRVSFTLGDTTRVVWSTEPTDRAGVWSVTQEKLVTAVRLHPSVPYVVDHFEFHSPEQLPIPLTEAIRLVKYIEVYTDTPDGLPTLVHDEFVSRSTRIPSLPVRQRLGLPVWPYTSREVTIAVLIRLDGSVVPYTPGKPSA